MSLKKPHKNYFHIYQSSPVLSTRIKKETSFCAYQKASLTVEAAVILPLTIGFLSIFVFYFHVLSIQATIEDALIYTGRVTAVESVAIEDEATLYLFSEAVFKQKLLEEKKIERYVLGGVMGVSLLGSELSENPMVLKVNCMIPFPIELFGQKGIWLSSENHFVKWKGDINTTSAEGLWVYISETGSVYHKDRSCRSLDLSIQDGLLTDMSLYRGANGQRYSACMRCINEMDSSERVYFTDYGRLYHGKISCSALKRTISKVHISQITDKRPCSFCY